uniref:Uncharacterized protein n=1 Tax=Romanomermis culicivorax TaxID=13658 RepID=A0A915JUG2_ROMCU
FLITESKLSRLCEEQETHYYPAQADDLSEKDGTEATVDPTVGLYNLPMYYMMMMQILHSSSHFLSRKQSINRAVRDAVQQILVSEVTNPTDVVKICQTGVANASKGLEVAQISPRHDTDDHLRTIGVIANQKITIGAQAIFDELAPQFFVELAVEFIEFAPPFPRIRDLGPPTLLEKHGNVTYESLIHVPAQLNIKSSTQREKFCSFVVSSLASSLIRSVVVVKLHNIWSEVTTEILYNHYAYLLIFQRHQQSPSS